MSGNGLDDRSGGLTDDPDEPDASAVENDSEDGEDSSVEDESEASGLTRGEWFAAFFWLFLGVLTIGFVFQTVGLEAQLLAPGVILVAYGLFVLWNPDLAGSDAPWTGLVWIALGVVGLVVLQVIELYWAYRITGIMIAFFLIFAGVLVAFDL